MSDKPVATFYGWMPNGVKTTLAITLNETPDDFDRILNYQNMYLARGFTLEDPAFSKLEAGEKTNNVGYVLRYDKVNKHGTISHWIGLYPANDNEVKKYLWVYLDKPEDIKAFEEATGLKVANMKIWPTNQAPERAPETMEYIYKVNSDVKVIYKANPDYNPEEPDPRKRKPARLFVRWANATPTPQPQPAAASAPVAGSVGNPTHVIDDEAELRRKAATALDNEYITIFKVRYEQTRGGVGVERWIATANVEGGGTVPVTVYGEDANRITKAGYTWPKTDGDNLAIPVITELRGSDRRITHVEPLETAQDAAAWVLDKPTLLTTLANDPRTRAINYKERNATVEKMIVENAYSKVATLGGAIEMTVMRLQSHHAERKTA